LQRARHVRKASQNRLVNHAPLHQSLSLLKEEQPLIFTSFCNGWRFNRRLLGNGYSKGKSGDFLHARRRKKPPCASTSSARPTGAKFHEHSLQEPRVEDNGVILSFSAVISTKLETHARAVCVALPSAGSFAAQSGRCWCW